MIYFFLFSKESTIYWNVYEASYRTDIPYYVLNVRLYAKFSENNLGIFISCVLIGIQKRSRSLERLLNPFYFSRKLKKRKKFVSENSTNLLNVDDILVLQIKHSNARSQIYIIFPLLIIMAHNPFYRTKKRYRKSNMYLKS